MSLSRRAGAKSPLRLGLHPALRLERAASGSESIISRACGVVSGRQSGSGMRRERPRLLDGCAATSLVLAPIVAVVGRSRRIPAKWQWKESQ
jgi:hypothetical protein